MVTKAEMAVLAFETAVGRSRRSGRVGRIFPSPSAFQRYLSELSSGSLLRASLQLPQSNLLTISRAPRLALLCLSRARFLPQTLVEAYHLVERQDFAAPFSFLVEGDA